MLAGLHALVTTPGASIALSYLVLAMMPGPNFLVVARAGLSTGKRSALLAAFGVATGAGLVCAAMLNGLGVLAAEEAIRRPAVLLSAAAMAAIGGRCLLRPARKRTQARILPAWERMPPWFGAFGFAFLTAASNPATALFFATSTLAGAPFHSGGDGLLVPCLVFCLAFGWFACVALAVAARPARPPEPERHRVREAMIGAAFVICGCAAAVSEFWRG